MRPRSIDLFASVALLGALAGCGATDASSASALAGAWETFQTPPKLVRGGGPIIEAPQIQLIAFGSDDAEAQEAIRYAQSPEFLGYLFQGLSQYDVRMPQILPPVVIRGPFPGDSRELEHNFESVIRRGDLFKRRPVFGPSYLHVFIPPKGVKHTRIDTGDIPRILCELLGGYHGWVDSGATGAAYAVVGRCAPPLFSGLSSIDSLTGTMSHEIAEAITDPRARLGPKEVVGYRSLPPDFYATTAVNLRVAARPEIADLCRQGGYSIDRSYARVGDHVVHRVWSDVFATVGLDPCFPNPESDHVQTYVKLTERADFADRLGPVGPVPIVRVAKGASETVKVRAYGMQEVKKR